MGLAKDISRIPQIARNKAWCHTCGAEINMNNTAATLGVGWPKCCGYTMSIDSPEERAAMDK
jgi:Zn finger protein HypA/HybF involved in hydrogenase expression